MMTKKKELWEPTNTKQHKCVEEEQLQQWQEHELIFWVSNVLSHVFYMYNSTTTKSYTFIAESLLNS